MDFRIFDTFQDSILILDRDFNLVYVNDSFVNVINVPLSRLKVGQPIGKWIRFWPNLIESFKNEDFSQPSMYREYIFRSASKCRGRMQIHSVPLPDGKILLYGKSLKDEERLKKRLMKELNQKEGIIEKLDRKLYETALLYEVSQAIHISFDGQSLINTVLSKLEATFDFSRSAILFFDDVTFTIKQLYVRTENKVMKTNLALIEDVKVEHFLRNAVAGRMPLFFQKDDMPEFDSIVQQIAKIEANNYVLAPFISQNRLGLVLLVDSATYEDKIENSNLINALGNQMILALDNFELYQKSIEDGLTGLFNNRYFFNKIESELLGGGHSNLGVTLIDIDHFKTINDSFGHLVGDQLLRQVAQVFRNEVTAYDVVARMGGDEFAILYLDKDIQVISDFNEKIRSHLESQWWVLEGKKVQVTVSMGTAMATELSRDANELLRSADKALYLVKETGRNSHRVFGEKKSA